MKRRVLALVLVVGLVVLGAMALVRAGDRARQEAAARPVPQAQQDTGRWAPQPGAPWQWQLAGTPAIEDGVDVYEMDGQQTTAAQVRQFKDRGKHTVCYLSAGTREAWRPDAERFPAEVVGKALPDWPDEHWLDIRRLDVLRPIMAARMDECAAKGFDAVDADNVDGHVNDTGFPLSADDQLNYNRALAQLAHERGLSVALKNDLDQIEQLEPDFDFAINEECFAFDACEAYGPFLDAGKAVLNVEYEDRPELCARAEELGLSTMRKHRELDAWRAPC